MAEKVLVAPVGRSNRAVMMDARIARQLVGRGRFKYVTEDVAVEEPAPPKKEKTSKPKKRTYKRRDMTAE